MHPLDRIESDNLFRLQTIERPSTMQTVDLGDTVVVFPSKKKAEVIGQPSTVLQAVKVLLGTGYRVVDTGLAWDETVSPRQRVTFAKLSR